MIEKLKYDDHEDWLRLRSQFIGGSDSAAVIGLNPYKSRYTLWAEKTGRLPGFEGNITTKVGAYLEELIAQMFADETGKKVQRVNASFHNTNYDFAIANLDRRIVGEQAFLECKSTNSIPVMKTIRNGEVPAVYYTQCCHYLAVTGYKKAYLAVLMNCRDFKIYEIERDQAEIDALMEAEKDFWQYVESDTAPGVDGTESTSETLKTIYPESISREVDLTAYETELREYLSLTEHIKELTKLKDEKANIVKEYMTTAEKGKCGNFNVSFKSADRKSFDTKAFSADHKDIPLEKYYTTTTVRTFKVVEKGDK